MQEDLEIYKTRTGYCLRKENFFERNVSRLNTEKKYMCWERGSAGSWYDPILPRQTFEFHKTGHKCRQPDSNCLNHINPNSLCSLSYSFIAHEFKSYWTIMIAKLHFIRGHEIRQQVVTLNGQLLILKGNIWTPFCVLNKQPNTYFGIIHFELLTTFNNSII